MLAKHYILESCSPFDCFAQNFDGKRDKSSLQNIGVARSILGHLSSQCKDVLSTASQTMTHIHNYSAGPCILPAEVLEKASEAVKSWDNHGLSLVEMSHRSKAFVDTMEECRALTKELLGLPDRFEVLYLQGGASLGFLTAAMNLLPEGGQAAYADTGTWSAKAIKEASTRPRERRHVFKGSNYDPHSIGRGRCQRSCTSRRTTPFLGPNTPACLRAMCRWLRT